MNHSFALLRGVGHQMEPRRRLTFFRSAGLAPVSETALSGWFDFVRSTPHPAQAGFLTNCFGERPFKGWAHPGIKGLVVDRQNIRAICHTFRHSAGHETVFYRVLV